MWDVYRQDSARHDIRIDIMFFRIPHSPPPPSVSLSLSRLPLSFSPSLFLPLLTTLPSCHPVSHCDCGNKRLEFSCLSNCFWTQSFRSVSRVTLRHTFHYDAHNDASTHTARSSTLQHTLQHTATHCNTLQHTTTHCNTDRKSVV